MRKIFITAGHRGKGTGAVGRFDDGYIFDEGLAAIRLRDLITQILRKENADVVNDEDTEELHNLVKRVNKTCTSEDILVDLHFNACNGKAKGSEVLHQEYPTNEEIELAEDLLMTTCTQLGTKCRGIKDEKKSQHSRLAILSGIKCHSVLVEVCFCDNKEDKDAYVAHEADLAKAYADVILQHIV